MNPLHKYKDLLKELRLPSTCKPLPGMTPEEYLRTYIRLCDDNPNATFKVPDSTRKKVMALKD